MCARGAADCGGCAAMATARRILAEVDAGWPARRAKLERAARYPEDTVPMRWCPECRRRAEVEEVTTESVYDAGREQFYAVTWLACGHHTERHQGDGLAPGAPYAGPERGQQLAGVDSPW